MSVTPGYLIQDPNRSSSRVLARPGGNSTMGSIIGDPNAKFDDGRQQLRGSAGSQRPQQQQQQQQQQPQQQYQAAGASGGQSGSAASQFAHNKAVNQSSNVFNYDHISTPQHSRRGSIGRGGQNQSDIFNQQPTSNQQCPRQSAAAARQRESHVFGSPVRYGQQSAPVQQQQPQYQQQQQQQQQQQPQQQQQQPRQSAPHTSVRVRAPPGGHSSISFG